MRRTMKDAAHAHKKVIAELCRASHFFAVK